MADQTQSQSTTIERSDVEGNAKQELQAETNASSTTEEEDLARSTIERENMRRAMIAQEEKAISTTMTCGKCKQSRVAYYSQVQARPPGEPRTTFCECTVCGNRWKISEVSVDVTVDVD